MCATRRLHGDSSLGINAQACLVLSEFAGAAQSLGAGAILVNPWNITDMAAAIEDALTMSDQVLRKGYPPVPWSHVHVQPRSRAEMHAYMQSRVTKSGAHVL